MVTGKENEVFDCPICKAPTQQVLLNKTSDYAFKSAVKLTKMGTGVIVNNYPAGKKILDAAFKARENNNRRILELNDGKEFICELPKAHYIYRCVLCEQDTYFLLLLKSKVITGNIPKIAPIFEETPFRQIHRYPHYYPEIHEALPPTVQTYLFETESCYANSALNATACMARLTVDEIARLFEADGKDLFARLNQLETNGILNEDIVEIAQQIRQAGRNGAHAEWSDITAEQAANVMYALRELMRELYITPHEREKRKIKGLQQKPKSSKEL